MALMHSNFAGTIGITGSRGFIGTHLKLLLDKEGISYKVFEGNLLNNSDTESFFQSNAITTVIHLVGSFEGSFQKLVEKNVLITQNLLEAGNKAGLKKIIYASTGAVYGEPVNEESMEEDPLQPNTLYGLSKKFAEDCIRYYHKNHGIGYIILRYPNVYGKGNNKGVLYNFLQAIKQKGEISIAGTGEQSRNFLHVTDACHAITKALFYDGSEVFNISNPVRLSINDIVEEFRKYYQFSVNYKPQDNYLKDLLLNISKAEEALNFKVTVPDVSDYIQNGA